MNTGSPKKQTTRLASLRAQVESNMNVQQIQIRKLAAFENEEKGFGTTPKSNNGDFKDLIEITEEMLRTLQRMLKSIIENASQSTQARSST